MQTIFLDGAAYATPCALHDALQTMLHLPIYYGRNADALADCLSVRPPIQLWVYRLGEGEVRAALEKCMRVIEDCGGCVRVLSN